MWNKTQQATWERTLAKMREVCPKCEALLQMGQYMPQFRDRIQTLIDRSTNAREAATLAIEIGRSVGG